MAESYKDLASRLDWELLYESSGERADLGERGSKAITALIAERDALREAMEEMLTGWEYLRHLHADSYGGWDRVEQKARAALNQGGGNG